MSDAEREEALKVEEPVQEKRGTPNPKTGLIGVYMRREKYQAQITFGGKQHHLGTFETKEQAGMAYDRFVVDKSTEEVFYTLNYPNMSDPEREEALKVEPPKKRKRGQPNQKTGLIGVYLKRKMYQASIWIGGKQHVLGRFDNKIQAGMVYDRFVVDKSTDAVSYNLNYPNMSDQEREEALDVEAPPKKKRNRGTPNQKTGLIGVSKSGKKYQAQISCMYAGTSKYLGTFDTKEQAGIAYDREAITKSTAVVSYKLNYPTDPEREEEEALEVDKPVGKKRQRGTPNSKTGLIGVYKSSGDKYTAKIKYGGTQKHLGTFVTKEQAGIAYDRFVVDKSTKEVSYTMNYPNMTDHEREVALPAEPPHKKRKRGTKRSKEESDDGSSSSSGSCHRSDDEAVEPTPSPPPPPIFERDPMLDQLFADEQNKKQQEEEEDQVVTLV
jgi:serine protease inhibitor ecotin